MTVKRTQPVPFAVNTTLDYFRSKIDIFRNIDKVKGKGIALIIAVVAAALLLFADDDGPVAPQQSPSWSATGLNGNQYSAPSLKGQVVVLDFWSTTCLPCVQSIAQENVFVHDLTNKAIVIGLTSDDPGTVREFLQTHAMRAKIGFDAKGLAQAAFKVPALPTAIVIDRFGNVVYKQTPPDYDLLERVVQEHL